MEPSIFPTSALPAIPPWLQSKFPRAYLRLRQGLRSGIVRYRVYEVINPEEFFRVLASGKTPEEALHNLEEVVYFPVEPLQA